MFKIEFYCEDPHVGPFLRLLAGTGRAREVNPKPLLNAEPDEEKGVRAVVGRGSRGEMFVRWLQGRQRVQPSEIRDWCQSVGVTGKSSYTNYVTRGRRDKLLGRRYRDGSYAVRV